MHRIPVGPVKCPQHSADCTRSHTAQVLRSMRSPSVLFRSTVGYHRLLVLSSDVAVSVHVRDIPTAPRPSRHSLNVLTDLDLSALTRSMHFRAHIDHIATGVCLLRSTFCPRSGVLTSRLDITSLKRGSTGKRTDRQAAISVQMLAHFGRVCHVASMRRHLLTSCLMART